ncbi:MAG: hypothetical protein JW699_00945 [Chitinispirillaceae bacterium]|nr:hypothetical protein [Chitinispirillaceae bacterium]
MTVSVSLWKTLHKKRSKVNWRRRRMMSTPSFKEMFLILLSRAVRNPSASLNLFTAITSPF